MRNPSDPEDRLAPVRATIRAIPKLTILAEGRTTVNAIPCIVFNSINNGAHYIVLVGTNMEDEQKYNLAERKSLHWACLNAALPSIAVILNVIACGIYPKNAYDWPTANPIDIDTAVCDYPVIVPPLQTYERIIPYINGIHGLKVTFPIRDVVNFKSTITGIRFQLHGCKHSGLFTLMAATGKGFIAHNASIHTILHDIARLPHWTLADENFSDDSTSTDDGDDKDGDEGKATSDGKAAGDGDSAKDGSDVKDDGLCTICLDKPVTTGFVHTASKRVCAYFCETCALACKNKCPRCRLIGSIMRVHTPK